MKNFLKKIKEWLKRRWFQSIIASFLLGAISSFLLTFWGIHYSISLENKRLEQLKHNMKPDILIEVAENKETEIYVTMESKNKDGAEVNKLFFNFDIPGVLKEKSVRHKNLVEKCEITSFMKGGHGGKTDHEAVYFECTSLLPGAYYSAKLIFTPADEIYKDTWIENYGSNFFRLIPFDYSDYAQYTYTWSIKGNDQITRKCLDLSDKDYIKKDNQRMIEFQNFFSKEARWVNNEDDIKKLELERKNIICNYPN